MLKSLTLTVLVGLVALIGWSSHPDAQTTATGSTAPAPVPGPYAAAQPAARNAGAQFPARSMRHMMPYWMRPAQPTARNMAPQMRPGPPQQYIKGWVWSPHAPNAKPSGSTQPMPRLVRRPQRPIVAYGYQNAPQDPYFQPGAMWQPNQGWPQNGPQMGSPYGARNYGANYPYGAAPPYDAQYGVPRTPNR